MKAITAKYFQRIQSTFLNDTVSVAIHLLVRLVAKPYHSALASLFGQIEKTSRC